MNSDNERCYCRRRQSKFALDFSLGSDLDRVSVTVDVEAEGSKAWRR